MSSESTTSTTSAPPAKYSRYRSVRNAPTAYPAPETVTSPTEQGKGQGNGQENETQDGSIQRSRSRYRQRAVSASASLHPPIPSAAPLTPPIPWHHASQAATGSNKPVSPVNLNKDMRNAARLTEDETRRLTTRENTREPTKHMERERSRGRTRDPVSKQDIRLVRQRSSPQIGKSAAQLLEEQKRKDLKRLQDELDAAQRKKGSATVARKSSEAEQPRVLKKRSQSVGPENRPRTAGQLSNAPPLPRPPSNIPLKPIIKTNGAGVDAPVSAVNAGERRVLVRCKQSSINLPITPTTTTVDLIYSAANVLSHSVAPSAAVLVESYTSLDLERRLRRYEHVRDVMNSWDRDTQNALLLQPSDSPRHDFDLDALSVPKKIPNDVTVHLYHSQKPGKWNKRYITLLSTGQIFMSKRVGAKATEKDVVTLCHLTDFDIYSLGSQQAQRSVKPPKKFCHAIKSQQKTAIFLSTEDYVHFFSTDDVTLSEQWYDAVQSWRSWYLIHMKGVGKKDQSKRAGPNDPTPYTIGTFSPLVDSKIQSLTYKEDEVDSDDENLPRQIPFHLRNSVLNPPLRVAPVEEDRRRHPPPVALNRKPSPGLRVNPRIPTTISPQRSPRSPVSPSSGAFAPKSLLGRTYTQRQQAQRSRAENTLPEGPFISGPSLLNSLPVRSPTFPPNWMETSDGGENPASPTKDTRPKREDTPPDSDSSTENPKGHYRNASQGLTGSGRAGNQPAPLLEFKADQLPELPHRNGTGKGKGVPPPIGAKLVEAATGMENMI